MSTQPEAPVEDPDGPEGPARRAWLSAAADGQADAMGNACAAWRDDASARATWHAYHLIGDVLRSSELATPPRHDELFLQALRLKLAAQPVVLAPAPLPDVKRKAPAWFMPSVAAAGVAAVAGVLVVTQVWAPQATPQRVVAASQPGVTPVVPVALGVATSDLRVNGALLRNPRLDEFLRAHQAARGGIAVAVPGSALHRADVEMPAGTSR